MGVSWQRVLDKVTINGTGSQDSRPIRAGGGNGNGEVIGLKIQVHSGSAPDVQALYQVVNSGQGDALKIADTEDIIKGGADWFTPETGGVIIQSLSAAGVKGDGHSIMPTDWFRIRVKGINSNGTNTVASAWVAVREGY